MPTDVIIILFLFVILIACILMMLLVHKWLSGQEALLRSKLEEARVEKQVTAIIHNMTDAVISLDSDGIVHIANAATHSLLDTNVSIVGRPVKEILPIRDISGKAIDLYKTMKKLRTTITRDDILLDIADTKRRLSITCTPIRTGYRSSHTHRPSEGYIIIARDITKAKSLEDEKDEFIGVVSHELRTPIAVAEGSLSNILELLRRHEADPRVLASTVSTAHDQILYLSRMINDLSTLSRAERSVSDDKEIIDLHDMIHALYNEYQPQAAQKSLTLNLELCPQQVRVLASPLYLKELLQNLITNALKYTQKGSITLRLGCNQTSATVCVVDTGIGIHKGDQARIFEKFYRSEDYRTRETSGTGLGLYVSAKLADKLGTRIDVESRLNHGSTFSISLPVTRSPEN